MAPRFWTKEDGGRKPGSVPGRFRCPNRFLTSLCLRPLSRSAFHHRVREKAGGLGRGPPHQPSGVPRPWWLGRTVIRGGGRAPRAQNRGLKDQSRPDVVVAGGGVVLLDVGLGVEAEGPEGVDPAADALAVAAARAGLAAEGEVIFDRGAVRVSVDEPPL